VRWIAAAVSALVVLGLAYWYTETRVLRTTFGRDGTVLVEHTPGSDPEIAKRAYKRCSGNSVERLARIHGTQAHPVFVAAAIGAKSGNPPAAYKACLRACRD
jgi:hypothetical protein